MNKERIILIVPSDFSDAEIQEARRLPLASGLELVTVLRHTKGYNYSSEEAEDCLAFNYADSFLFLEYADKETEQTVHFVDEPPSHFD